MACRCTAAWASSRRRAPPSSLPRCADHHDLRGHDRDPGQRLDRTQDRAPTAARVARSVIAEIAALAGVMSNGSDRLLAPIGNEPPERGRGARQRRRLAGSRLRQGIARGARRVRALPAAMGFGGGRLAARARRAGRLAQAGRERGRCEFSPWQDRHRAVLRRVSSAAGPARLARAITVGSESVLELTDEQF